MSEQHPGSAGDPNIQPPPGQGFPPPPQYPGQDAQQPPPGYPPNPPGYPAPQNHPSGPTPAQPFPPAGYPSGPTPAQGYPSGATPAPGFPPGPNPGQGYPSGNTPAQGFPPGPNPGQSYPSGNTPAQGFPPGPSGYPSGPNPGQSYPSGNTPAQGFPPGPTGYPSGPNPGQGYPSGATPAQGFPPGPTGYPSGPNPGQGYPSGATPAQGYPTGQTPMYQGEQTQRFEPTQAYEAGPPGGYQGQAYPGYPAQGQYQPGPYQQGQTDYLGTGQNYTPAPPSGRRAGRRGLWIGVAVGTVVILGAASVGAYTLLSGGGTTLDAKAPADAVAYAEVNLDPPAGQKVAALRYLHHFPNLKVQDNANTLLDGLLDNFITDPAERQKFVSNVQPWLGKHVAVVADPQGNRIQPVFVLEATDTNKAKDGLTTLQKDEPFGFVIGDGTVTLAQTQAIAQQAADDAKKSALADTSQYSDDIKAVGGDEGVITAWANFEAAAKYLPSQTSGQTSLDSLKGVRLALTLKFTDTVADLTVKTFGGQVPQASGNVGDKVAKLPDDTAVAVGISGGDKVVRQAYDALKQAGFESEIQDALGKYNLQLPDDLATLVGSQTVVAVGGSQGDVQGGVITKTDNPSRAREVAEKLLSDVDSSAQIVQQQTPDGLALASSQDYLSKITGSGGLGNSAGYKEAVPDAGSSQYVIYVDMQRTLALDGSSVPDEIRPLKAIGMSASTNGNTSTLHLRVVVG